MSNHKFFGLVFLILLSMISFSLSDTSTCTEQWTEIDLPASNWSSVGDAKITNSSDGGIVFEFERLDTDSSSTDIGGAVWHNYDFSKKRGLLISFKPTIKYDSSYFGNAKYPQGFAIVFTSSSTDNLIGEKGHGIGYQGIMNAFVFEFDFIRQSSNNDFRKPHFSIHYNISGEVSASSIGYTKGTFNIEIPNFYDNSLDGYYKNIIFEIQIIGSRIILKSNRDTSALVDQKIPEFQKLLEQEDIHVGITSSMNQNKKVTISNFKISEVSTKEKANLSIKGNQLTVKAGEEITLLYSIQSICGNKLKIYSDEYTSSDFILKVNDQTVKPNSISFDESSDQVQIIIIENIENIYTARVEFGGHSSIPIQFTVTTSDVLRYEYCYYDSKKPYNITPSILQQTKDYIYVPICSFDQFGNRKKLSQSTNDCKIKYPNYLVLSDNLDEIKFSNLQRTMVLKVPFNTFGLYEIFNENFEEGKIRYCNLLPTAISPEKSELSILYDNYIINADTKNVSLKIKVRDNYGRDVPQVTLEEMNCRFSDSKLTGSTIKQSYKDDFVLLTVDNPKKAGKYTFVPKIQCDNIALTEFYCGYNDVTKLNNCEFYYPSSSSSAAKIQAYSDYLDSYTTYEASSNGQTPLIVSLDEKENYKLTEIILVDSSDIIIFEQSSQTATAKLDNKDLTVRQIGHKYIVLLPEGNNRDKYTPTTSYTLVFTINSKTFNIPVQFFFLDQFMCNVDTTKTSDGQVAFYLPFSKTFEAAGTILLFNIYEKAGEKLGSGDSLDASKVSLLIDSKQKTPKIVNHKSYISVTSYDLSVAGKHEITLNYNSKVIAKINVEIKAKDDAVYLGDEKGVKLTSETINVDIEKLYKYTLLDKYGNVLKNNQVFNAFGKIKVVGNKKGYLLRPNFDGKIHLYNHGQSSSFVIKIGKGTSYTVKSTYSQTFDDVDPLNSYGIFDSSITPVLKNNKIAVNLYLRDKYGNNIKGTISKNNITVYVEGENLKEIIILNTDTESVTDKVYYSGTVGVNGDFVVKIFINEYPVECKGCHFRNSIENNAVESKSTLYILGNKRKIPIINTGSSTNLKVGLINKNSKNFVFQLEQRDEYSNELKDLKSTSLFFGTNDATISTNDISICSYGSNEDERGYYKFCTGDLDKVSKLSNGIYKIYTTSETTSFYVLITDSLNEDGTPVEGKSMILLNDNNIYGKTDVPGFFILDLRTNNYKRLKSVDKSKVTISNSELSIEVVDGPESGLVTVFLVAKKPGKYEFTVNYDGKSVIKDTYNYICACGFSKKLVKKNVSTLYNGNYLFFSLTDDNGNLCYNTYNWNELNINDYGSNLITIKDRSDDVYYRADSYYNHKSSTFILYLDRHVSDAITLSSDIITIDSSSKNIDLGYHITNSLHFYASISNNVLTIKVLDDNYNNVKNHDVTYNDFDVSLYRIVNDDVVIIKNDFTVKEGLTVDCNDSLLDAKGKYFYVVYFKGYQVFCENCIIDKSDNSVDMTKTRVYHKEGNLTYIEGDATYPIPLFKGNFPFFKINLYTSNNNLAILSTGVTITFKGTSEIKTGTKIASNGNIYVYLTSEGRESFLKLSSMDTLTLTVTYSGKSYSAKYYVMNQYVEKPTTIEHCSTGAVPIFMKEKESYSFIKRYDEELELEIELTGCASEQLKIIDKLSIMKKGDSSKIEVEVIPMNNYGAYLLFLPTSLPVTDSQIYYIVNSNSKSEEFELTVMPGYEINSISLIKDTNMKEDETNKLFTYFLAQLKDKGGNIITNVGRNILEKDINGISINNLPYTYTYDETQKAFRFQVPITGNGKITVKYSSSSLDINVDSSDFFLNSLVKLEEKNNTYTFEVNLKDEFYKTVSTTSKLSEIMKFRYITINPVTEEVFTRDIKPSSNTGNKFTVTLDGAFPKYSVYGFIPLIRLLPQICPTCLKKNEYPDYIYSLGDKMYVPRLISKKQYLIQDYDIPFYIYVSHKALEIKTASFTSKELVSKTLTKLYILTSKDSSATKTAEFANSKILNVALIDYSKTTSLTSKTVPSYVERYGYNAFSVNVLDNKPVTFFMEIRGDEGALITTTPNLNYDNLKDVIKKVTIINTCYTGVYFIKVTFLKSDNTEFYLKFTESQTKDTSNTMQLQITSAFPNQLVLNNKEKINERVVSFALAATNSNAEEVCDKRLNIYIDDMNLKKMKTFLSYNNGICSLYVEFYGDAVLKSNIGNFYSDISNNEYNLYNVNPQFSSTSVSPNTFTNAEESLTIVFNEKSPSLTSYSENEITTSKNIYGYKFVSPTKIKKMKTFSGLYSDNYSYSANKFSFEEGDVYVLIGSILGNNLYPSFAHYEIESDAKQAVNSVNAVFINQNKRDYCKPNFISSKLKTGASYELNLPSIIRFSFLDSKKAAIDFDKSSIDDIKVELILDGQNTEKKTFPLILNQINDYIFIAKFYTTDISTIKQLPVIFSETNYGYLIKISSGSTIFYSLLSLKNNVYQTTNIKGTQYEYPYNTNSLESFDVYTEQKSSEIYVPSSKPNIQHICLFIKDSNSKTVLVNKHLDPYKIKITVNSKDVPAVNSYLGCMAFSSNDEKDLSVQYNSKNPSNSLTYSAFSDSSPSFTLLEDKSSKTFNQNDNAIYVAYKTTLTASSNEYFKVYINEVQAKKSDITVSKETDYLKISIPSSYFTTNPRNKKIAVLFDNGVSTQKVMDDKEWNVAVTQKSYDASSSKILYKFKGQDPLTLKVGDNITYYLTILDTDLACYYEKFDALKNMKVNLALKSKTISTNVTYRNDVKGYSQCEYIYLLDFKQSSTDSGNFDLTIEDGQIKESFKVHISSQDIDESKAMFYGKNNMKAGETIRLNFTGTDANSNSINYFDLFKIFDIKLVYSNGTNVEKKEENYSYIKRVASDNSKIIIDLTINLKDNFTLVALKNDKEMKLASPFKITVEYGSCSTYGADPQVKPIDNRMEFYAGETIVIGMKCKDTLGNIVTTQNNEIFLANIKQNETNIVYNHYNKTFENGEHLISFVPSTNGNYSIDITLNGKKYGNTLIVRILPIDSTKYNCMDKRFVNTLETCNTKEYRDLLKDILGDDYMCDTTTGAALYKCNKEDKNCVSHTNGCKCSNDEWNGFCYDNTSNPIKQVDKNKQLVTCLSKIKASNPDSNAVICQDGSCRMNAEECNTTFECPIGFRVCGTKCILLGETCSETNTCESGEVLCWDLSCAMGYDLCPTRITCPTNKVLCPDGSCQEKGHCIQPNQRTCGENEYQCSDFSCVSSRSDCPKNKVCGVGLSLCDNGKCQEFCKNNTDSNANKYHCSNGDYVDNLQQCPASMFTPTNYVKCPDGGMAINLDSCAFIQKRINIVCPKDKPILCPDYACVSKSSECSTYIPTCPNHKPYQCWDNECRASLDECPTMITCAKETPVLCQNGLCVKSSDECVERVTTKCNQFRCFDGTCVSSMELCPTYSFCGEGNVKCWNGACVATVEECRSSILDDCPKDFNYRCPDGSCRTSLSDCSTITVCPSHLPIKCFDNSCRASLAECPKYQTCGANRISCPDGTCALSFDECNTIVTCSDSKPFLCYDNSCKKQITDCPEPTKCSKNEILCPNGACVSYRQNCKLFEPCETSSPVRCENNICTNDFSRCPQSSNKCPTGYVQCTNGDCKTSEYLCDEFECPKNKPILCKEGVCVHDKSLCDNQENGCPYNAKHKCPDGTCVSDEIKCSDDTHKFECKEGQKKCVDGSCIKENLECPLINGCYKDRPFKCADGTCINPDTTTCPLVFCPFERPYKCPNGYCVEKSSDCPKDLFDDDINDCGNGNVMCVDGRCVESSDYCRPFFMCENGYERCQDGTCRIGKENCPQYVKCPDSRPYSTSSMICSKIANETQVDLTCPDNYHKCTSDGLCVSSQKNCQTIPNTETNGCINGGIKCPNGRCMKSLSECSLISNACPDDSSPYLCPNGECIDDLSKCSSSSNSGNCDAGKIKCSSGRCINNDIKEVLSKCTNNIGCPLEKPYRCSNGECVKSQRNCDVTTTTKDGILMSNIACDVSKPYLCSDKSCVSDPSYCKPFVSCSVNEKNCYNGYCVGSSESCTKYAGYCPTSNPISCPSGTCVDDIIKCSPSFIMPSCSEGEFYCSRLNKCLKKKLDCLGYLKVDKKEKASTRRLLENFIDPLNDDNFINIHNKSMKKLKSFIKEDDEDQKDSETKEDYIEVDGVICYDGTIAAGKEKCPVVPACKIGYFRADNGACVDNKENIITDEDYVCIDGQKKCPDGLCHKDCNEVAFNGCEVGKYQCSNGLCVEDKYDCIGHSMCPDLSYPYRCINGECKSSPDECGVIERLGTVKEFSYSFNKLTKIEFSFAYDINGRPIGKIEIPGNGLQPDGNFSQIYIEEISTSVLDKYDFYNHTNELIYNVSNSIYSSEGVLTLENSVMSPAFKIYSGNNNIKFNLNGTVNMEHNEYDASGLYPSDYCLGRLKGYDLKNDIISDEGDKGWECVERQSATEQTEFQLSDFGVYAIILNPLRQKINYFGTSTAKNFFLENVKIILIVFGAIILIFALVFYIFSRVTRYRQKYHENRTKILLLQQQKQEYENMTTDIFGQTLGDNINGIVYKANPAYTVTDEIKKSGTSLEEEIEKLQIECRNVNDQNERLQKDIADITDQYKTLSASIENMN